MKFRRVDLVCCGDDFSLDNFTPTQGKPWLVFFALLLADDFAVSATIVPISHFDGGHSKAT